MMTYMGSFMFTCLLLGALTLGLAIYALVELSRQPMDSPYKLAWVLIILLFPILGSLASLIMNRGTPRTA